MVGRRDSWEGGKKGGSGRVVGWEVGLVGDGGRVSRGGW